MAKKIFLSFKYDEQVWHDNALQLFQANGGRLPGTPVYLPSDALKEGERSKETIKRAISERLEGCVGLLGLIGNGSQHSKWIHEEVRQAEEKKVPCAFVRHPQGTGGVPEGFRNIKVFDWNGQDLADWVTKLMG